MAFDPKKQLIQLKGKWYLQANARTAWFREENPDGAIVTEVVSYEPLVVKATVYNGAGQILGVDHAGAKPVAGAVWNGREVEKACTAAIGRALALCGYGTLQAMQEEVGDDHLSDSPVEPRRSQGDRDRSRDKERLNGYQPNRVTTTTNEAPTNGNATDMDDLRNRAVAEDFIKATRAAGFEDGEVLAALGVAKLSHWPVGRRAAETRVKVWQALNTAYAATAKHFNHRKHFDALVAQLYPDGIVGLDTDELIAAIEADRTAQHKTAADKQFANV